MGYTLLDRRVVPTPVNASGLYRNLWVHCKERVFMDNTEKRIEFSKKALERAKDFTEEKIVQKWLSIFEKQI